MRCPVHKHQHLAPIIPAIAQVVDDFAWEQVSSEGLGQDEPMFPDAISRHVSALPAASDFVAAHRGGSPIGTGATTILPLLRFRFQSLAT